MTNKRKKRAFNFGLLFHKAAEKGIVLLVCSITAIFIANSSYFTYYSTIFNYSLLDNKYIDLHLTTLDLVNDFFMAVFFLLVGLEIKREMIEGHLTTKQQRVLPISAACCGVIVPVIIYSILNVNDSLAIKAWAVPAATDIAFPLGILALFGQNLPTSLRVFLTALAIIDDLIAVIIIALFYSGKLSSAYLFMILICSSVLYFLNKSKFSKLYIYILIGLIMWYCFFKSGVHATISGILLAYFIPMKSATSNTPLLQKLEQKLSPLVLYFILPVFAFANSGVTINGLSAILGNSSLISLGIVLGLFLGKQIGIFSISYFLIKKGLASMPSNANFQQLYGISVLCGIGFTMSLFVGTLAYKTQPFYLNEVRLGVLCGSFISSIFGAFILQTIAKRKAR